MSEQPYTRQWRIDFKGLRSKESMLKKIAAALEFPAHFGNNLDALYDCLTDLPLQKGERYAIFLDELDYETTGNSIYTVFADAREAWADQGVSLSVLRD